jgi:acyl-CoA thioesterase-2
LGDPLLGQPAVDRLLKLLDLEQLEVGYFRGLSPEVSLQRVFGGQVAGQALVAASRTVSVERSVHSLHGYFIRAGDPAVPILYTVEPVRDGRSFTTRRVTAIQHGRAIFFMSASFQVAEEGFSHQSEMPDDVPPPDDLEPVWETVRKTMPSDAAWNVMDHPIDLRYVGEPGWVAPGTRPRSDRQQVWMRIDGKLPDDQALHACALTYASDLTLLDSTLAVHGKTWAEVSSASLDHAVWFHRPFRADEWFLYDCYSPSTSGGRGLASGKFFAADGTHIATVLQEGLIRPARPQ